MKPRIKILSNGVATWRWCKQSRCYTGWCRDLFTAYSEVSATILKDSTYFTLENELWTSDSL